MRRRTMIALGLAAIGLAAIAGLSFEDRVLLNSSPSVPTGLYLRTEAPVARGALVTVRAVDVARDYARTRDFADAGDRFIKRVAASAGETVCGQGDLVTVGSVEIRRQSHDSSGRPLPTWSGCRVLQEGELFLLGDTPDSFDSRYFGVVRSEQIEGVWRPL